MGMMLMMMMMIIMGLKYNVDFMNIDKLLQFLLLCLFLSNNNDGNAIDSFEWFDFMKIESE